MESALTAIILTGNYETLVVSGTRFVTMAGALATLILKLVEYFGAHEEEPAPLSTGVLPHPPITYKLSGPAPYSSLSPTALLKLSLTNICVTSTCVATTAVFGGVVCSFYCFLLCRRAVLSGQWLWGAPPSLWYRPRNVDPGTRSKAIVLRLDSLMPEWNPRRLAEVEAETPNVLEGPCPICLDPFVEKEADAVLRTTPFCHHVFHSACIEHWVSVNMPEQNSERTRMSENWVGNVRDGPSCPVCRTSLDLDVRD
jgi:hypothetical protein